MRLSTKPRHPRGSSLLELAVAIVMIAAAGGVNYGSIKSLHNEEREAKKTHALVNLETAKNQFIQDASPEEREKFSKAGDEMRFAMISQFLTPNEPAAFINAYHIATIKVNDLGIDPSAE